MRLRAYYVHQHHVGGRRALEEPELRAHLADAAAHRRIAVVGSYTIVTFRGWLIEDMVAVGHAVFACAPNLNDGDIARLQKAGADYRRIGLERTGINPLQDFGHIIRLATLLRRLKVEVVLAHTTKAMIVGCLAARLAGVPRIFAIIEGLGYAFTDSAERKRKMVRALLIPVLKAALAVCSAVFVLNSDDRATLIKLGVLSPQQAALQIGGTGLDLDHFTYAPPTPGPPRFLLIARMVHDKGIVEYVQAARMVKLRYPEARFRLLGSIDNHPSGIARDTITAWEAEGVVEYLGIADDVRPFLADCTAYVLPSYREGMPRSVMEAMATGRPIIATDVPGCRDIVKHGINGLLVAPRDAEALANAVAKLIATSRRREHAMGLESRRLAQDLFPRHKVNKEIIDVIFAE